MTKVSNLRATKTKQHNLQTSSDTDGQQRKHTKQIQKLSQVKVHLEKLFRKKYIRQSSNFSRHNAQTFRHLPIPNRRKMQETRTMSTTPLLELNVRSLSSASRDKLLNNAALSSSKPGTSPTALQRFSHISMSLHFVTVGRVGNTFPMFQDQAASSMELFEVCTQSHA